MRLTLNKIPTDHLQWLVSSRIEFLNSMREGHPTKYFAAHLPVMSTWSDDPTFPVNMTVKGLGLLPRKEKLQHYSDIFEDVIADSRSSPWDESLHERLGAINKLYGSIDNFDSTMLGGLEIFTGKAFENMKENQKASLLYIGMSHSPEGMKYISFQVNGNVEILEKGDPYYRFLLASRKLFEFDKFHLFQSDYPYGYLIRIVEIRDKSPWSKSNKR